MEIHSQVRSRRGHALLLLALGTAGVIIEFMILLGISPEGILAALGAYALFMLPFVFRGLRSPVGQPPPTPAQQLADEVVEYLERRSVTATLATAVAVAAVLGGVLLYRNRDPPDALISVIAFTEENLPGKQIGHLPVIFDVQAPASHKRVAIVRTDADGVAEFSAHKGDLLRVRIEDRSNRVYVLEFKSLKAENLHALFDSKRPSSGGWRLAATGVQGAAMRASSAGSPPIQPLGRTTLGSLGSPSAIARLTKRLGLPGAEILIGRDAYVAGFDPRRRQARWVAYEIRGHGKGVQREDDMRDPLVREAWQANDGDYRGSGLERGHLVPFADVAVTQDIAQEAGYFTTVVPVKARFNKSIYVKLKNYTVRLKKPGGANRVFVIRGPVYIAGSGPDGDRLVTIGASHVPVPTHIFQIAAVLEGGRLDLECFLVPNLESYEAEPNGGLNPSERYRTDRAAIERASGLRFFTGLAVSETGCR